MQSISISDKLSAITVYDGLRKDKVVRHFISLFSLLEKKHADFSKVLKHYSKICNLLYHSEWEGDLTAYLLDQILCDENIFTVAAAKMPFQDIPKHIATAATLDLTLLWELAEIDSNTVKQKILSVFPEQAALIHALPGYANDLCHSPQPITDWGNAIAQIAAYHQHNGVSVYAKYYAFYLSDKQKIVPVKKFTAMNLEGLKKYELQKQQIVDNTVSFLRGKPANNVLLYGDRGTGKSSTVNAILNDFHQEGLRMIQVKKEDILYLNSILKVIGEIPLRFIIFIDDLTFNENDECFNTLKAVLEGSLNGMPKNVLIYATTNRRHLIKETFSGREGNELHASDTRDENASLADRFGLTITFTKPNLNDFLEIVCEIAKDRNLPIEEAELRKGANIFAMRKASRSGRIARQYVDYVEGRLALGLSL